MKPFNLEGVNININEIEKLELRIIEIIKKIKELTTSVNILNSKFQYVTYKCLKCEGRGFWDKENIQCLKCNGKGIIWEI